MPQEQTGAVVAPNRKGEPMYIGGGAVLLILIILLLILVF